MGGHRHVLPPLCLRMNNIKVIPAMSADLAGAKNPAYLGYVSLIETPHWHGYLHLKIIGGFMILHDSAKPCIKGPKHIYGSAAWVSISSISFELPYMIYFVKTKNIYIISQVPQCKCISLRFEPFSPELISRIKNPSQNEARIFSLRGGRRKYSLRAHHHEQDQQQCSRGGDLHAKRWLCKLNL